MSDAALRVGVVSLGCSKNLVDTEVMLGHLDRAGCAFVTDPAEADVLVVNTCGFIEAARAESIEAILEAASYKTTGRLKRLVVAACLVQQSRDELRRELPEVDAFIGLDELPSILGAVGLGAASPPPRRPASLPILGGTARAPVRIQERFPAAQAQEGTPGHGVPRDPHAHGALSSARRRARGQHLTTRPGLPGDLRAVTLAAPPARPRRSR